MPSANLVLVDTSVWIDYLTKQSAAVVPAVDRLLDNGQIATAAIILAELNQGARGQKEIQKLKNDFRLFGWIEGKDQHWEEAGKLSFRLRQAGKTVNLSDCYIASLADGVRAKIFSLDKHFRWIAELGGCTLFET